MSQKGWAIIRAGALIRVNTVCQYERISRHIFETFCLEMKISKLTVAFSFDYTSTGSCPVEVSAKQLQ